LRAWIFRLLFWQIVLFSNVVLALRFCLKTWSRNNLIQTNCSFFMIYCIFKKHFVFF
jgi:hypothetical protein